MTTLLLTTLVLCFAESVLPCQDIEDIQNFTLHLAEGLEQHSPQYNRDRLNQLEQVLACRKPGKEGWHFKAKLVETHVFSITADSFKGLNLTSSTQAQKKGRSMAQFEHAIRFPEELMRGIRAQEEQTLVCIYIHSSYIFLDKQNSSVLNNHILGAFLKNRTVTGLRRPVEIQFWHNMVLDASNATCVFWVPGADAGSAGSWSSEGCETQHKEGTVVCLCNHLTYFAVLMVHNPSSLPVFPLLSSPGSSVGMWVCVGVRGGVEGAMRGGFCKKIPPPPPFSQLVGAVWDLPVAHPILTSLGQIQAQNLSQRELESLTYISTVGCSISATATFCTLLLCCFFRRWPQDNTTRIHMNLLAALFLLNGSFLLSKPLATSTKGPCRAAAALLHGSLLCSLAWMGAEAFHLYLLLVKVYNIYIQQYLLKLCLFAWASTWPPGLPTLVVMAVLIFSGETYGYHVISTTDGYKNMNMCWLTSQLAHKVTLCYAGLILLFNMLMLVAVVAMLRRIQRQKGQARRDWATVLGLTCLLGTTWGLAFFSFGVFLIPQLYLFTILNSLQGLFICLWYLTTYRRSKSSSDSSTSR
ncbi:adhesion G-protein coupled receptor G5 isoform X2 [Cygnus olor]|uniref:adhesion G-protein coupled receptor G5 isoform X2 n=1 Tax=Cygnus olor TaxID=8869 RepID=UPI001ADE1C68|nr:adhesion G-protein coupled receptor G5 isoform X2 [Cygnus olor]XP_040426818.1 adhesion G-protein coupled receptor G5 isoform X2 [Cygnus olor]